jgi:hypothetical protein
MGILPPLPINSSLGLTKKYHKAVILWYDGFEQSPFNEVGMKRRLLVDLILPMAALCLGFFLIYSGLWGKLGKVWAAAGGLFITVSLGSIILTLAASDLPYGPALRSPVIRIVILAVVFIFLGLTILLGLSIL